MSDLYNTIETLCVKKRNYNYYTVQRKWREPWVINRFENGEKTIFVS